MTLSMQTVGPEAAALMVRPMPRVLGKEKVCSRRGLSMPVGNDSGGRRHKGWTAATQWAIIWNYGGSVGC